MLWFYALTLALFMLDYTLFVLLNVPLAYSLLALYILELYRPAPSIYRLLWTGFLLGLASFAFHGTFGLIWIALIPSTALIGYSKPLLLRSALLPYVGLSFTLVAQLLLARLTGLSIGLDKWYTIKLICVNILVMLPISLTVNYYAGRQGNRLRT